MLLFGLGSFSFTFLSLTFMASGEDSDVTRLGGETSPIIIGKRRVNMGRARIFRRVKTEKKIKGHEFLLLGEGSLREGILNAKLNQCELGMETPSLYALC